MAESLKWLRGCTLCNMGIVEEVERQRAERVPVLAACTIMADQAAERYPELADEFSADKIRDRYRYWMQHESVGEIIAAIPKPKFNKQINGSRERTTEKTLPPSISKKESHIAQTIAKNPDVVEGEL